MNYGSSPERNLNNCHLPLWKRLGVLATIAASTIGSLAATASAAGPNDGRRPAASQPAEGQRPVQEGRREAPRREVIELGKLSIDEDYSVEDYKKALDVWDLRIAQSHQDYLESLKARGLVDANISEEEGNKIIVRDLVYRPANRQLQEDVDLRREVGHLDSDAQRLWVHLNSRVAMQARGLVQGVQGDVLAQYTKAFERAVYEKGLKLEALPSRTSSSGLPAGSRLAAPPVSSSLGAAPVVPVAPSGKHLIEGLGIEMNASAVRALRAAVTEYAKVRAQAENLSLETKEDGRRADAAFRQECVDLICPLGDAEGQDLQERKACREILKRTDFEGLATLAYPLSEHKVPIAAQNKLLCTAAKQMVQASPVFKNLPSVQERIVAAADAKHGLRAPDVER